MKAKLSIAAVVFAPCLIPGCASPVADEATRGTGPVTKGGATTEIVKGQPVNNGIDVVSKLFPLSTVALLTQSGSACTGVILSGWQILSAAHCGFGQDTWVFLYGTSGATPVLQLNSPHFALAATNPVDLPDGVTPGDPTDQDGNLADLAVLNLATQIPNDTPWAAVSMASLVPSKIAWAVGTGDENGKDNPTGANNPTMQWEPATTVFSADISGGSLVTSTNVVDLGDSGGPLFQLVPDPSGLGTGHLVLVGILSGIVTIGFGVARLNDKYTAVTFPSNLAWIQRELAKSPP